MSDSLEDFLDAKRPGPSHDTPPGAFDPPKGWRPGVKISEDGSGEVVAAVEAGEDPKWGEILTELGYGDVLELVRVVEVRAWQVYSREHGTKTLHYVKAKVARRASSADAEDVAELKERVLTLDPGKPELLRPGDDATLLAALADWQLGKREGGGSEAVVRRVKECTLQLVAYAQDLRSLGIRIPRLILAGLGDLVEACWGHYPMQLGTVDLHMRQQRTVARRLLVWIAKTVAPHFEVVDFRFVPGNHGETRQGGKQVTSFSDNNDVCLGDQLRDVLAEAPWAEHITVWTTSFTEPELSMSFLVKNDAGDSVSVGLAHGHQAKGGPQGVVKWWDRCAASRHPIGAVDLLNTGHYHHLRVEDRGARKTWFQAPTLDGGSFWYWAGGGNGTVAGMLCYLVTPSSRRGWSWVKVLTP